MSLCGGGVFTYIVDLANRISDKMDVIVAYSERKQTPENIEDYFNKNIKLIKVENFVREINLVKDTKACFEVRKIIKKEKPDIVHLNSSKAGGIGRLAIFSKKIKLFYTPHSYSFCREDESKFKIKIYKIMEKILGLRNCLTIACSKSEYEQALKVTKKCMYINNGIDINEINEYISEDLHNPTDTENVKICTVGRIGNQKNPEMFNEIAKEFPEKHFTWIGDGELAGKLTSPNINVLGWCERKQAIRELCKNDVFILPSLWEGLPITLLEAMYLKKACIVSNISANKNVIENEVDGFVCNTKEEYCDIIRKIDKAQFQTETIGNRAREKIVKEYNVENVVKKYLEVYTENNSKGDDCY